MAYLKLQGKAIPNSTNNELLVVQDSDIKYNTSCLPLLKKMHPFHFAFTKTNNSIDIRYVIKDNDLTINTDSNRDIVFTLNNNNEQVILINITNLSSHNGSSYRSHYSSYTTMNNGSYTYTLNLANSIYECNGFIFSPSYSAE